MHATSINAVAGEDLGAGLLKHYFEKERGVTVEILSDPCTPGTKKGSPFDVYPLLCMWDALHKDGTKNDPYFQVDLPQNTNGFSCFFVFSMSSYLRGIREDFIEIEMRAAVERIQWLHKLFHLYQ